MLTTNGAGAVQKMAVPVGPNLLDDVMNVAFARRLRLSAIRLLDW